MAKKIVNVENQTVVFQFDNAGEVTFDLAKCSDEMKLQLMLHGASQKIGDSYASAKSATADLDIDPAEWSREQAAAQVQNLYDGDWTVRGTGTGTGVTDLAVALAEASGQPLEECVEVLATKDKDEKAALRKHPAIEAILARLRRERAEAKEKKASAAAKDAPSLSGLFGG